MSSAQAASGRILVVSSSDLLQERIARLLARTGSTVQRVQDPQDLAQNRRQRPFLLCFVDVRNGDALPLLSRCCRARPAERYVLITASWQSWEGDGLAGEKTRLFGVLREPFSAEEVRTWVQRALDEDRLVQGDRSLEDVLYSRFRFFLQNLGPGTMNSLHDLVWEQVERPLITAVLEWTGGNQSRAAELLGIHRNTLRSKIRALDIAPERHANGDPKS